MNSIENETLTWGMRLEANMHGGMQELPAIIEVHEIKVTCICLGPFRREFQNQY